MRSFLGLLATATVLAAFTFAAHADIIDTFTLNDVTFANGGTATGTVTIDITNGSFTNIDATYKAGSTADLFIGVLAQGLSNNVYVAESQATSGDLLVFNLPQTSMVGYAGGNVCSLEHLCNGGFSSALVEANGTDIFFETGSLTTTPEPSTLALFGTGILGLAGMARRKFLA